MGNQADKLLERIKATRSVGKNQPLPNTTTQNRALDKARISTKTRKGRGSKLK